MSVSLVTSPDAVVPLELTIEQEGVGGVAGKAPTVQLRDGSTLNSFLDWDDWTFKIVGWSTRYKPLGDAGGGHYGIELNLATMGAVLGNAFIAQYDVDDGGVVRGTAHDIILVGQQALADMTQLLVDVGDIRKVHFNRQEVIPGNPGYMILFDDDGVSPYKQWELRDAAGNGIIANVGCSAKRSAAS